MEINPISIKPIIMKSTNKKETSVENNIPVSDDLVKELDKMSMINNVNISKRDYELNLPLEELQNVLIKTI